MFSPFCFGGDMPKTAIELLQQRKEDIDGEIITLRAEQTKIDKALAALTETTPVPKTTRTKGKLKKIPWEEHIEKLFEKTGPERLGIEEVKLRLVQEMGVPEATDPAYKTTIFSALASKVGTTLARDPDGNFCAMQAADGMGETQPVLPGRSPIQMESVGTEK